MRLRSALPAALTTLAAACTTTAFTPDGDGDRLPVTRLRAEPYSFTYNSGLRQPARFVIRDEVEWRAAWDAVHGSLSPKPELPAVDFAREMVVVAALGERSSGGYGILVDSARAAGTGALVYLRTIAPGTRCGTTGALTQPVDLARLPRREGGVEFRERAEVTRCD
ncbi:MAG TPA: protease complex subunit PrcB family protein [Gemmatimonadaceae bacterium]|nr:protease complex subunit PrcB family protein [Gemmatimonadaceae bacterium]